MNRAEREEMARLLPSPGNPAPPSDRLLMLEDHLMREITRDAARPAADAAAQTPSAPPAPRPRRRLALLAVPLGTAAVVVATVLSAGGGGEDRPVTDQEAVGLLNRIATVAEAKDTSPVRDDQYIYLHTQGTQQIMDEGEDVFRRSDWRPVDGRSDGLARITVLSGPSGKGTTDMALSADPNAGSYREIERLPTDPARLYDRIWAETRGQGPTHEEAALERIGALLPTAVLLPETDAALYRAAAMIPGVTVVDDAKDAAGRRGIGLAFGSGDDRDVWVFDREDLTYLGSDDIAVLDVGAVDELGETPAG
ncbi:CU044_5270 family protein [Streptomyces sp. B93]|uniref:CU044_5270 family protein n=1 Tax=Streptomyces sp. B93 TaxID=2824875 RepID=UPI001B389E4B|nr:CU044_5270 family protein [Streptomyces sp. B93]MBQ1093924.1 CU044_5270 family protein [Streptomyces sp. B93]